MAKTITTNWPVITKDVLTIKVPTVEWKTILRDFYQLTAEVDGIPDSDGVAGTPAIPATYRGWVNPIDLNDAGAVGRIIEVGYSMRDYFGQVFAIIAVNEDGSIDVSDENLYGYCPPSGRQAVIFNDEQTVSNPKPPDPPKPVVTLKWFEEDLSCVMVAGINTGQQIGVSREKKLNTVTGLWVNTGNETPIDRINYSACPLPAPDPYRAGQYTGMTFNPTGVTAFTFTFGSASYLETIPLAGRNYLFLSLPVGKTFKVIDGSGANITSKFYDISTSDNVSGYQNNKVWRKNPPYASGDNVPYEVTIYN